MKLVSLATWGCKVVDPIFEYIKKNSETIDVFCFQEILQGGNGKTKRGEIKSSYEDIAKLLPGHTGYFSEYGEFGYFSESSKDHDFKYGIACFVRSDIKQSFVESVRLYDLEKKWGDYSGELAAGVAQAIKIGDYVVVNVHGLWQGHIKKDTEAKIEQSKKILKLAEKIDGQKIICGDFNLMPDTKSISLLGNKYRDLIKEYKIKETRSSLYTKEFRYSDYIFVDKKINVDSFLVHNLNISDHLPLFLEFK